MYISVLYAQIWLWDDAQLEIILKMEVSEWQKKNKLKPHYIWWNSLFFSSTTRISNEYAI